ncbi:MAG: hypothetical protein RPS47_10700 [Colwellia sp.]
MSDIGPVKGWRVHPKAAKVLLLIIVSTVLLGLFSSALELSDFIRHMTFTICVICICAFVLPRAKIWQNITEE